MGCSWRGIDLYIGRFLLKCVTVIKLAGMHIAQFYVSVWLCRVPSSKPDAMRSKWLRVVPAQSGFVAGRRREEMLDADFPENGAPVGATGECQTPRASLNASKAVAPDLIGSG